MGGCPISEQDIMTLADATDTNPAATFVRCDVVLEALSFDPSTLESTYADAGVFALDHIRDLLWRNAAHLKRTRIEWIADVQTVFAGFDRGKTGFIPTEDFITALSLLNSSV